MEFALSQVAALLAGEVLAGEGASVSGVATLAEAGPQDLSFFGNERYLPDLRKTKAGIVLVPRGHAERPSGVCLVAVDNPSAAFAEFMKHFAPPVPVFQPGIHATAVVDPTAKLNPERVCVGPFVVIAAGAEIGDGTEIASHCHVGRDVMIGRDCRLFPRVVILDRCVLGDRVALHSGVVIGADGFGYEFVDGVHRKIDQTGIVQIDSDVEIGANTTIDRARFGKTWIGEGAKIDNQVMIGHNCVIGKHAIIIAQAGIAGSTRIGDYAIIAAQAGVGGHLEIAPRVIVAAQAGVTKSLSKPGQYMGFPAGPVSEMREILVCQRRLPALLKRISALEKQVCASLRPPPDPTD